MAQPDARTRAYRARLAAVRSEIVRRLERMYGEDLDTTDVVASLERWIRRAAPVLEAGQASVASLAEAFLERRAADAGVDLAFDESTASIAGTTRQGNSIDEAMGAIGPMILGQIAAGHSVEEAQEFGRFAVARFADDELTGTVDRIGEDPAVHSVITGWEGFTQGDACDGCQENEGIHELTWTAYRHGGCNCTVEPVFGAGAAG